jgi:hypothetical protein
LGLHIFFQTQSVHIEQHSNSARKMKKITYLLFSGLTLLAVACDKKLDIEPQQSISENIALNTDANVKLVLLGAYDNLSQEGIYGGNLFRDAELAGSDGEIRWVGTFNDPRDIFNHTMDAGNLDGENTWSQAYAAINTCNNVLSALGVVNEADRAWVEGEARFIRAVCYYELVRLYGKTYEPGGANTQPGVPLVTEPTRGVGEASFVSRSSVGEVYEFVHDELHAAYDLMPEEHDVYANKYVAAAVIARMHLSRGEYDESLEFADVVINSGYYSLLPQYADNWNQDDNTAESIFSMQVSDQDGDNELVTFFSIPAFGGRDGDIEIQQKHLDLYDAADARLALFYEGSGAMRTGKWRDQYKNIPVIRLAEMYLIRAECNSRLGNSADDDYNAIHTRAGLPAKTGVTLDDILLERHLELAFEGQRIHDIKRQRGTVDGLSWDDNKLVFPIPARELEANKSLEQNDGY